MAYRNFGNLNFIQYMDEILCVILWSSGGLDRNNSGNKASPSETVPFLSNPEAA